MYSRLRQDNFRYTQGNQRQHYLAEHITAQWLYGDERAKTILNNCDNRLYLGGSDADTARYIGIKANKSTTSILNMPLDSAWLFTRGSVPRSVRKFVLEG